MAYHFGQERRKGSDRRVPREVAYAGAERRVGERRARPREREGPFAWIVLALIAFIIVDAVAWHGYYRHAILVGLDAQATATRAWSDGLWDWGSTR